MQAFIAKGELVRARAVLDKARREGHSPDAYSYTALMRGHAAQGQAQEAGAVFREMIQDGVAPNVVSWLCRLWLWGCAVTCCLLGMSRVV